jgi:hypothetical protein
MAAQSPTFQMSSALSPGEASAPNAATSLPSPTLSTAIGLQAKVQAVLADDDTPGEPPSRVRPLSRATTGMTHLSSRTSGQPAASRDLQQGLAAPGAPSWLRSPTSTSFWPRCATSGSSPAFPPTAPS